MYLGKKLNDLKNCISLSSSIMVYSTFALILSIFFAITWFWRILKNHFSYWERRQIPHLKPKIPTGNMQQWTRSKHYSQIFNTTYAIYKDRGYLFAGFYFNMQKAVIALDLELVKSVLVTNFYSFERRGLFHNERSDPLTGNVFLLDGPEWKTLRSKLTPSFTAGKLKYIFPTMANKGDDLRNVFVEKIAEGNGGVFDVTYVINRFTCDVIANCVYGVECQSMTEPNTEFAIMARLFFSERRHSAIVDSFINCFPEWAKTLRMKVIPHSVTNYFMRVVRDTLMERACLDTKRPDYLGVLMDLKLGPDRNIKQKLTGEQIAAHLFSFFITAFDTCSSTLSCALYELARRPDIQNKLRVDIRRILNANSNKLTYDCLKQMQYLDQVTSETLRKYPSSPAVFRKCTKTFIPHKNPHYRIEEGCLVIIPVFSMHYDSKYFPNPFDFDPDRFSPDNVSKIEKYSYLPFGEGQRACIGMNFARMLINIALLKLVTNFKFDICGKTRIPINFAVPTFHLQPTNVTLKVKRL